MARPKSDALTPLEIEIMNVLWESGPANVQAVQKSLERDLAYTTVQTMLNILLRKGRVKRVMQDRAYVYKPAVSRKKALSETVSEIVEKLFGGSAESLVMSLVDAKRLTPEKLAQLKKLVEKSQGDADENP